MRHWPSYVPDRGATPTAGQPLRPRNYETTTTVAATVASTSTLFNRLIAVLQSWAPAHGGRDSGANSSASAGWPVRWSAVPNTTSCCHSRPAASSVQCVGALPTTMRVASDSFPHCRKHSGTSAAQPVRPDSQRRGIGGRKPGEAAVGNDASQSRQRACLRLASPSLRPRGAPPSTIDTGLRRPRGERAPYRMHADWKVVFQDRLPARTRLWWWEPGEFQDARPPYRSRSLWGFSG